MLNISSISELKNAIQLLEDEQTSKELLLKKQLLHTYESLKPVNLLKNTIKEVASSPYLIDNVIGTAIGLASGYLTKKIVVNASGNMFRKLIGSVLQFGVTNLVAQNPETIKSFGKYLFQLILSKKEMTKSENRD